MGLKRRLRATPQPLSVINRHNRHSRVDWFKARLDMRRRQRDWEPPSDTWWRDYDRPKHDHTKGLRRDDRGAQAPAPKEDPAPVVVAV